MKAKKSSCEIIIRLIKQIGSLLNGYHIGWKDRSKSLIVQDDRE
jgi:hypothetical protein